MSEQTYSDRMRKAWQRCEEFNKRVPIGTKVTYRSREIDGEKIEDKLTKTRSEAWALHSGHPVVMIEGRSGGVSLDHVQVIA